MLREELVIWSVGFFDGEGHIGVKSSGVLNLAVSQRAKKPLLLFQELYGGKVYVQGKTGVHQWHASNKPTMVATLTAMLPYLVVKKVQAELALQYLAIEPERYSFTPGQRIARADLVAQMKAARA